MSDSRQSEALIQYIDLINSFRQRIGFARDH